MTFVTWGFALVTTTTQKGYVVTMDKKLLRKMGITEQDDAGINLGWDEAIDKKHVDAAILITKQITPGFIQRVVARHKTGFPLIVHATCTGLGSSVIEPNVPAPSAQLDALCALIDAGFPKDQCVLRIDPIIPSHDFGLQAFRNVLEKAEQRFGDAMPRIRISVIDQYRHVIERFRAHKVVPIYDTDRFYANDEEMARIDAILEEYPHLTFETCAEPKLRAKNIARVGCLSHKDLEVLNLELDHEVGTNAQNRGGCLCLALKTQLLNRRHPCAHGCLYCYWKD